MIKPTKVSSGSIGSESGLCNALSISRSELTAALTLSEEKKYTQIEKPKPIGVRIVHNPNTLLRKIQRRINSRIFTSDIVAWPDHLYGSIPNQGEDTEFPKRDYIACAARHCGAKSLLNMDIQSFFDNINKEKVRGIFESFFRFKGNVPEILAELCTFHGAVVQGALTSSYIANLVLHDVEEAAITKLNNKGLVYTRLVDDITVSAKVNHYNFDYAIKVIEQMLLAKELPLNHAKTKVQYTGTDPLMVHGLRVSFKEPRLPSDEPKRIRAATKRIEILASERNYRTSLQYREDYNRCMGRVNKLARVGHNQHGQLIERLKRVRPLPSKSDIERALVSIKRLEHDCSEKQDTYWYYKRYNILQQRINLIKLTYEHTANRLQIRMSYIKPTYEK